MTLGLICLQASLQYGRTVYHLLLTTAGYSLLIGALLCVGLIILGDFLLMSYTGPESITKTIRSPDNEHAIVISAQTTRAFIEEAQYTRYKIKRIAGLFQPEWPFYYVYQDTVGVDLSPRLEAIRWTDNNHFTYRIGQQAYYCNIHRLYNLENCTTKQPKN
jgi:hypothetical protein